MRSLLWEEVELVLLVKIGFYVFGEGGGSGGRCLCEGRERLVYKGLIYRDKDFVFNFIK